MTSSRPVPRGAGGLKYFFPHHNKITKKSRPARGGWIEMIPTLPHTLPPLSRPARGGWIEIICRSHSAPRRSCPVPRGAGGLKSFASPALLRPSPSRPARGGWIEITAKQCAFIQSESPVPRGAGGLKCCMWGRRGMSMQVPSREGRVD